ncbi:MAG: hypothetical protein A07HN63_00207 [uncultured archaeon A07HN63]|nr:MAG: hypothetical protein A07HN63_00207 [uncultured archaeon A07HN63]
MVSDTDDWYDRRWGRIFYWAVLSATLLGVGLVATGTGINARIPPGIYLFGFLGASVYAFTSFAKRFGQAGRYRLKILSRTVAVLPLVTGVYLLAFTFPEISGDLNHFAGDGMTGADRLVGGLVFVAGIYVSATLRALGGFAERVLGEAATPAESASTDSKSTGTKADGSNAKSDPE